MFYQAYRKDICSSLIISVVTEFVAALVDYSVPSHLYIVSLFPEQCILAEDKHSKGSLILEAEKQEKIGQNNKKC